MGMRQCGGPVGVVGRLLVAGLLALILVVHPARPASACSCATFTEAQAFARSDAVFAGALVEIRTPEGADYRKPERFIFEVDRVYKGEVWARQTVVTAQDGMSCGLEIVGRGPFVVYAETDGGGLVQPRRSELASSLCSGTRELSEGAVPSTFGAGRDPVAAPVTAAPAEPARADGTNSTSVVTSVAVGAIALVAAVLVAARLWRRPKPSEPT